MRSNRPALHDLADLTLGEIWLVYLLDHGGQVSRNPRQLGEYISGMFSVPVPGDEWHQIRDAAILAHEAKAQEVKEEAA